MDVNPWLLEREEEQSEPAVADDGRCHGCDGTGEVCLRCLTKSVYPAPRPILAERAGADGRRINRVELNRRSVVACGAVGERKPQGLVGATAVGPRRALSVLRWLVALHAEHRNRSERGHACPRIAPALSPACARSLRRRWPRHFDVLMLIRPHGVKAALASGHRPGWAPASAPAAGPRVGASIWVVSQRPRRQCGQIAISMPACVFQRSWTPVPV